MVPQGQSPWVVRRRNAKPEGLAYLEAKGRFAVREKAGAGYFDLRSREAAAAMASDFFWAEVWWDFGLQLPFSPREVPGTGS